jgi:hypothetical protein
MGETRSMCDRIDSARRDAVLAKEASRCAQDSAAVLRHLLLALASRSLRPSGSLTRLMTIVMITHANMTTVIKNISSRPALGKSQRNRRSGGPVA